MKKILRFPTLALSLCALFALCSLTACEQHSAEQAKLLLKKKAKHGEKHDKGHDDTHKTEKEAAEWEKETMEDEPHGEPDHQEVKKEKSEPKDEPAPSPERKAAPLFPSSKPTRPQSAE